MQISSNREYANEVPHPLRASFVTAWLLKFFFNKWIRVYSFQLPVLVSHLHISWVTWNRSRLLLENSFGSSPSPKFTRLSEIWTSGGRRPRGIGGGGGQLGAGIFIDPQRDNYLADSALSRQWRVSFVFPTWLFFFSAFCLFPFGIEPGQCLHLLWPRTMRTGQRSKVIAQDVKLVMQMNVRFDLVNKLNRFSLDALTILDHSIKSVKSSPSLLDTRFSLAAN